MRANFIELTLAGILGSIEHASAAERVSAAPHALQTVDARVKLAGFFGLIAAAAVARNLVATGAIFAGALALALLSHVSGRALVRLWAAALFFSGAVAVPALFLTHGRAIATLFGLPITLPGVRAAAFLVGRVAATTTLALILVSTTPWPRLVAAFRSFHVPAAVVMIVSMTVRYVFVLLRTSEEMFIARRSRRIGTLRGADRRRVATASAGVLLGKSLVLADDVHSAMRSRGWCGEAVLLDHFQMNARDWTAALLFAAAFAVALWGGLH